ncbi:glutamate racemase [Henriciella pelagia]|jgi:glutamate racemase|uniref:Glutamate racemase n=2 Tax=Henriciella pelagia TaxID=1977912 RepID=A0ABQ1JKL9_9PROT|nr:glutamate racemase [Henriciella pelagia]GGB70654.1 glutamate racemase [Henriciella pelagia]
MLAKDRIMPMDRTLASRLVPVPESGRVLVFDSGMGGLTVAREIMARAPQIAVDYAADTGFFPYGDKSDAELRERLPRIAASLVSRSRPDVFVIACNTASTLALEEVRAALDIPVIGTVPAIKPAVAETRTGVIGLLATPGTIRRAYTARLIKEFAQDVSVILHGSIDLVRLAEAHAAGERVDAAAIGDAQAPIFEAEGGRQVDTVVLACTHFPLVREQLAATAPRPVKYIDSGAAIARQTLRVLARETANRNPVDRPGGHVWLTNDPALNQRLVKVCRRFGFPNVRTVSDSTDAESASARM